MTANVETGIHNQYLTFFIGAEEYAIGILSVREILEYETLTKVPLAPAAVRGVINLRGAVVPVVDLAVKFGLGESTVTAQTCVVIVEVANEGEKNVMGVIADSVNEVVILADDAIEPPPDFGTTVDLNYLVGMGKSDDKFLLVLRIDKVLSRAELASVAGRVEAMLAEGATSESAEVA